jgi:flavin-dependent dehydrogenase
MKNAYDCIVMGAGPAGCAAAALVAEAGYSALLLEREKLPRFHVGESLMPETYWTLKRLGVLEQLKRSKFVRKLGVKFVSGDGRESQPFFFREHDPRECVETWQVERAEFDKLLFDNAAAKGAECRDQVRVREVLFDGPPSSEGAKAVGVRLELADGAQREVRSRVVVDATGQQCLLASKLGLRVDNPRLKKAAIWGYYRGAQRESGELAGGTIIMHTERDRSWFWYIPLSDDVTSIGVVSDHDYLLQGRGGAATVFEDELVKCPGLTRRLIDAELISKLRVAKEFSYTTTQHAGDGWVLVGDAFGFVDPIYSSGVFLALRSAELAADAIVAGLKGNDLSAAQLGGWADDFNAGVHWIRKLVEAFYTDAFSFGAFVRDYPQHRGHLTDMLIGRVFSGRAAAVFDDLDPLLEQARSQSEQPDAV